jgi:serpin B
VKLPLCSLIVCVALPGAASAAQTVPSSTADQAAVVEGNNAFAVELYSQLRNQSGNLFFSPESISTALAMTYAGARGATASEMADTLQFTLPPERLHPAMGALLNNLNAAHDGYQLRTANSLWAEKSYTFLDAFLKLTSSDYGAGFNQVDFKGAPEAARVTINHWVEQKTENKIRDLILPGMIDANTRLVLTNAIYFKGDWQTPFAKAQTNDQDFSLSPPRITRDMAIWPRIKTPMMHRTGNFYYFNGGTFQALEIPYKGGELSMVVLLPDNVGGLLTLERSLTAYNMRQWLGQLRPTSNIILTLPKFKMDAQFSLKDTLQALGMKQAFDGDKADFSGMASRKTMQRDGKSLGGGPNAGNLYISAVIHKAYVNVDELGTEAAAATAVVHSAAKGFSRSSPPPPIIFCADHPFVFLIRENRSGGILFMGRVTRPSGVTLADSVTVSPDGKSATMAPESLDQRIAEFHERQEKLLQSAEAIVFSPDKSTADVVRSYPFLMDGSLNSAGAVRIAQSSGNGAGVNILFVYRQGNLARDSLGVYVDDGRGYKQAFRDNYMGADIHVSRVDGQVEMFIERTPTSTHTGGHNEFVLQNNVFLFRPTPHGRDCCGPVRPHQ